MLGVCWVVDHCVVWVWCGWCFVCCLGYGFVLLVRLFSCVGGFVLVGRVCWVEVWWVGGVCVFVCVVVGLVGVVFF